MRILLVDDHALFRSGMRFLLSELNADIIFFEADSAESALGIADDAAIDLILLDYYLGNGDTGYESLERLLDAHQCQIVLVSGVEDPSIIKASIDRGASGFIPKSSSQEILVAALRLVLANGIYLPPNVISSHSAAREARPSAREQILRQLSAKQLQVLLQATQGKPNKAIAKALHIAEGTVKAHLSACYRVLEVSNRTEAVYAAAELGLTEDSSFQ